MYPINAAHQSERDRFMIPTVMEIFQLNSMKTVLPKKKTSLRCPYHYPGMLTSCNNSSHSYFPVIDCRSTCRSNNFKIAHVTSSELVLFPLMPLLTDYTSFSVYRIIRRSVATHYIQVPLCQEGHDPGRSIYLHTHMTRAPNYRRNGQQVCFGAPCVVWPAITTDPSITGTPNAIAQSCLPFVICFVAKLSHFSDSNLWFEFPFRTWLRREQEHNHKEVNR